MTPGDRIIITCPRCNRPYQGTITATVYESTGIVELAIKPDPHICPRPRHEPVVDLIAA